MRLDVGRAQQLGDVTLGVAAAVTQYGFGGLFAGFALGPVAAPSLGMRFVAGAFAVGIYMFGRWGRAQVRAAARTDQRLVVQADCVIVRHGGLLAAPAVIPRDDIAVVAVDDGATGSSRHSLPVTAAAGGARMTWFWQRHSGASVPVLGPPLRAPNLVLLFTRGVDFAPRARAWPMPRMRRPAREEAGLLLRVRDPAAAVLAFAGWEALRPLRGEDLARVRRLAPVPPALPYGV